MFDVIEVSKNRQSIKPLVYRFKTDFLYYPLEITATSDAGESISKVNIFLITKGVIDKTLIKNIGLWSRTGFDHPIELSKTELKEVNPEIADLFSSAYVMNAYYYGPLERLNKDLVVYQQNIHVPTLVDKLSQSISRSLLFQYISGMWRETFTGYVPIWAKVLLPILLFSFIIGIPSITFILAELIKKLLRKHGLKSFGYSLLAYVVSIMIIIPLLLSNDIWLVIPILVVFTIIGFSMLVFLVIKFFKKYIF